MNRMPLSLAFVLVLAVCPLKAWGENAHNHLGRPRRSSKVAFMEQSNKGAHSLESDLHDAVSSALGDGHGFKEGKLLAIRQVLQPMWNSILKGSNGRIERRLLRYIVNRYFMQQHYISMVGLEFEAMDSSRSEVALLMEHAPMYVKSVLEGRGAQHGFSLEDAVGMVAALERLVVNSGSEVLDDIYESMSLKLTSSLTRPELSVAVRKFIIRWMIGDDPEIVDLLEANATLLKESFSDWNSIEAFAEGRIRTFIHEHEVLASSGHVGAVTKKPAHGAFNPFREIFSFQDAEAVVGGIATNFGRFWETECASIKDLLVTMDPDATGRIKLSTFYNTAMNGEWRFSESKEYLRQLGALDESSSWKGPQVIIPNYLQGASNCIVSTPHYRVCCAHECEDFLGELELAVGSPVGSLELISALVDKMTVNLNDETAKLTPSLISQLGRINDVHGGHIPLHGRLFAQWLHYVFPRECPYPHKAGVAKMKAPSEFGDNYLASHADMKDHVDQEQRLTNPSGMVEAVNEDGESWMSQWSHEEELLSDYAHLAAPWEGSRIAGAMFFIAACIVSALVLWFRKGQDDATGFYTIKAASSERRFLPFGAASKDHLV